MVNIAYNLYRVDENEFNYLNGYRMETNDSVERKIKFPDFSHFYKNFKQWIKALLTSNQYCWRWKRWSTKFGGKTIVYIDSTQVREFMPDWKNVDNKAKQNVFSNFNPKWEWNFLAKIAWAHQ